MAINQKKISDKETHIERIVDAEHSMFSGDNTDKRFAIVSLAPFSEHTPGEDHHKDMYLRFRDKVYATQTGMLPESESGYEMDGDDDRSRHFLVYENRGINEDAYVRDIALVACIRMMKRTPERNLPAEDFFKTYNAEEDSFEASRLISRLESRGDQIRVIRKLFRNCIALAHQENASQVVGVVEPELAKALPFLGAPCDTLEEPKRVDKYNDDNMLVEFDLPMMKKIYTKTDDLSSVDMSHEATDYFGKLES